jgi:predicted transcriptional regulator
MAESKVSRNNYIAIQGWMIRDLQLKGNELLIYACIYGFSQAENQVFSGSLQYLADWTNTTKQSVLNSLKSLTEKGYIGKNEKIINGVKFCEYYAKNLDGVLKNFEYPIQKSLMGGIQKSLTNNISTDNLKKNIDYNYITDMFNSICVSFSAVRSLSDARKKAIKARLNTYTVEDFRQCFENAESSSFLKGSNNRNWVATFDWLIKDANMAKVLEGNYNDKPTQPQGNKGSFDVDDFFNAALSAGKVSPRAAIERQAIARMESKSTAEADAETLRRAERLKQELQGGG